MHVAVWSSLRDQLLTRRELDKFARLRNARGDLNIALDDFLRAQSFDERVTFFKPGLHAHCSAPLPSLTETITFASRPGSNSMIPCAKSTKLLTTATRWSAAPSLACRRKCSAKLLSGKGRA